MTYLIAGFCYDGTRNFSYKRVRDRAERPSQPLSPTHSSHEPFCSVLNYPNRDGANKKQITTSSRTFSNTTQAVLLEPFVATNKSIPKASKLATKCRFMVGWVGLPTFLSVSLLTVVFFLLQCPQQRVVLIVVQLSTVSVEYPSQPLSLVTVSFTVVSVLM